MHIVDIDENDEPTWIVLKISNKIPAAMAAGANKARLESSWVAAAASTASCNTSSVVTRGMAVFRKIARRASTGPRWCTAKTGLLS